MVDNGATQSLFSSINFDDTDEPQQRKTTRQSKFIELSPFCGHCNLTFVNVEEFEHHNDEMHKLPKYPKAREILIDDSKALACGICGASFKRPDHLKRHMLSLHTIQKYYLCPVCGKECPRQDVLLKHINNKHSSGPQIFYCRECKHECQSFKDLEVHEASHLLTERHACQFCNGTFKRRDHMLRHVKSQHMDQSFNCPVCVQSFKRKDHLVRHVREKHKMGYINGKLVKASDLL